MYHVKLVERTGSGGTLQYVRFEDEATLDDYIEKHSGGKMVQVKWLSGAEVEALKASGTKFQQLKGEAN